MSDCDSPAHNVARPEVHNHSPAPHRGAEFHDELASDDDFFSPQDEDLPTSSPRASSPAPAGPSSQSPEFYQNENEASGAVVQTGLSNKRPATEDALQFANAVGRQVRLKTEHQEELKKIASFDSDTARILWIGAQLLKNTERLDAINPPDAQWKLPSNLYNKIELYTFLIITSPKCCVYVRNKNGPIKALTSILEKHPSWGYTSEVRDDKYKNDIVEERIRQRLTDRRASLKTAISKSIGDSGPDPTQPNTNCQDILELAQAVIQIHNASDSVVTLELCARLAYLRFVLLKNEVEAHPKYRGKYWQVVDQRLQQIRSEPDARKIHNGFKAKLRADIQKYPGTNLMTMNTLEGLASTRQMNTRQHRVTEKALAGDFPTHKRTWSRRDHLEDLSEASPRSTEVELPDEREDLEIPTGPTLYSCVLCGTLNEYLGNDDRVSEDLYDGLKCEQCLAQYADFGNDVADNRGELMDIVSDGPSEPATTTMEIEEMPAYHSAGYLSPPTPSFASVQSTYGRSDLNSPFSSGPDLLSARGTYLSSGETSTLDMFDKSQYVTEEHPNLGLTIVLPSERPVKRRRHIPPPITIPKLVKPISRSASSALPHSLASRRKSRHNLSVASTPRTARTAGFGLRSPLASSLLPIAPSTCRVDASRSVREEYGDRDVEMVESISAFYRSREKVVSWLDGMMEVPPAVPHTEIPQPEADE
ncbi:hypothetical protein K474DRAFT_1776424 [Panus rudis PR-1116 ss-1]|nr:hypothetical protein K474DRAFT_1776424 [Panus rudis PR-1116 ss-1]